MFNMYGCNSHSGNVLAMMVNSILLGHEISSTDVESVQSIRIVLKRAKTQRC